MRMTNLKPPQASGSYWQVVKFMRNRAQTSSLLLVSLVWSVCKCTRAPSNYLVPKQNRLRWRGYICVVELLISVHFTMNHYQVSLLCSAHTHIAASIEPAIMNALLCDRIGTAFRQWYLDLRTTEGFCECSMIWQPRISPMIAFVCLNPVQLNGTDDLTIN